MTMQLYYSDTMMPRKVCALARHLGSPVTYIAVDLGAGGHKAPDFLAMNPNGKVPVLVDGDLVLWESDAIMMHLAARAGSPLWPAAADRQVEVMRWLSWAAHEFNPKTGTLYFEHVIRPYFGLGPVDAAAEASAIKACRRHLGLLDSHLGDRAYLLGPDLTIADFSVAVTLPWAEKARIPVTDFPAVSRWHDRLMQLDAWRDPFPKAAAAAA
ncbi:glutathione S-transferase family protein [Phreatobacter sp.]|uniref:glutathione S-transferase family protein n=1 Tax=Phreatobacter sp. TaxID=1966341 RepID=UPI003F6F896B